MEIVSIDSLQEALRKNNYIADRGLATSLFLALRLGKPLLLEGEAGVGKTEVAKVMSQILETDLIRLQCYEGLDVSQAVYEWDYARQILEIRILESEGLDRHSTLREIFSEEFLIKRPLLQAIEYSSTHAGKFPVLLIDEVDRSDEEFEAFLLEILSDFQVTIPEIGTIKAQARPLVILTSNRTRELHDALKRRCLYYWIDYPSIEKEEEIIRVRVPGIEREFARQISSFMHRLRTMDLYKIPGVAESIDWASALVTLNHSKLDPETINETIGTLLKHQEDILNVRRELENLNQVTLVRNE